MLLFCILDLPFVGMAHYCVGRRYVIATCISKTVHCVSMCYVAKHSTVVYAIIFKRKIQT